MLELLDALAGPLEAVIFLASHALGGSLAGGIVAASALVRLALLPLTLPVARRARRRARVLAALRPELERLRERWAEDPRRLGEATLAAYRRHGVSPLDTRSLAGALVQLPVTAGFYRAVRRVLPTLRGEGFLWIRDLARPSPLLAVVAGALVLAATTLAPSSGAVGASAWLRVLPALSVGTVLLLTASGFGLHVVASAGVSALQAGLLRLDDRRGIVEPSGTG